MKRFWLFAGTGQPYGGMQDFQLGAQQVKSLLDWLNKNITNETLKGIPFTWFEIVNVNTNSVKVRGDRAFTSTSVTDASIEHYTFDEGKGKWMKIKVNKPSS